MRQVDKHLFSAGPKRILSLDGGGIRGIISLQILKEIEVIVQQRMGAEARLCDYFDLMIGTSTGAIIASGLALGWRVEQLDQMYQRLGSQVFKSSWLRQGFFRPKFNEAPLERELKKRFADITLGSDDIKTGLAIVMKRLDTGSPWIVYNSSRSRYYNRRSNTAGAANKDFLLRNLVRASSAAPTYFEPQKITIADQVAGAFVDGGVSPHNNPSLQAFMLATLSGYGICWPTGASKLLLVSVGTGSADSRYDADELCSAEAAKLGVQSLVSLMDDASSLNELLLQWMSSSGTARRIDRVVGDLSEDSLAEKPLLSYLRYDARLERKWLADNLALQFTSAQLESLEQMAATENVEQLMTIGRKCAERLVDRNHFAEVFDVAGVGRNAVA